MLTLFMFNNVNFDYGSGGRWVNQRAPEERTERRKDGEAEEGEDGNCAAMPSRGNERKEEKWGGAGILQNVGFWSEKLTK